MSVWRGFPLPPNPSWLRTHAEAGCATRNLPLPHQPWLLRPGLVLLFSSETLSGFCLLHGCRVSLRFFPRLSFPSDLGEVRDAVAIQDSFCRRIGKGVSPGQKVSDDGTRSSAPFGRVLLRAPRAAACGRAEGSAGMVGSSNEPASRLDTY